MTKYRKNPLGEYVSSDPRLIESAELAARNFKKFHDFDPPPATITPGLNIPKRVCFVGEALKVMYRSNKWKQGTYNYEHDHDGGVKVCRPARSGERADTAVPQEFQTAAVSRIGNFLGLIYRLPNGDEIEHGPERGDMLYQAATNRGRTALFVVNSKTRIDCVIFGGWLNVEARGIVY
jgi:hypothetical protein